tara:strand:- start:847 stop:2034 length:1188 start_codon:yes stop_codon:yes gene_type:complete
MTELWLTIVILTVLVAGGLLVTVIKGLPKEKINRLDYDITIFKHQLTELESDLEHGVLLESEVDAARAEIERRLLRVSNQTSKRSEAKPFNSYRNLTLICAGLGVPFFATGLYLHLGSPNYPGFPYKERDFRAEREYKNRIEEDRNMSKLVKSLVARLDTEPNDLRGWILLGRTHLALGREAEAIRSLRKGLQFSGNNPAIAVELAEALVISADNEVRTEARKLFKNVLSQEARNPRARYYLALADAQDGRLKDALQGWIDLLTVSPPSAPWRHTVDESIKNTAKKLRIDPSLVKPSLSAKLLGPEKITVPEFSKYSQKQFNMPDLDQTEITAAGKLSPSERGEIIQSMVRSLADRLRDNPDDLDGWERLERAYQVLGETKKAKEALAHIRRLSR